MFNFTAFHIAEGASFGKTRHLFGEVIVPWNHLESHSKVVDKVAHNVEPQICSSVNPHDPRFGESDLFFRPGRFMPQSTAMTKGASLPSSSSSLGGTYNMGVDLNTMNGDWMLGIRSC